MAQTQRNRLLSHFSQLSAADYRTAAKFKSDRQSRKLHAPTPIFAWVGVAWVAVILTVIPWLYGGATWTSQFWLLLAVLPLGLYTFAVNLCSSSYRCHVPVLSWLLLGLTGWALIQGARIFDTQEIGQGPQIVQLQRWFLGYPEQLESSDYGELMQKALAYDASSSVPSEPITASTGDALGLAVSTDPSVTFAAAGCLLCAAVLIWSAKTFFRTHSSISLLLGAIVVSGLVVFFFGISKRVAYDSSIWNISGTIGDSIGLFVSRNSAGAFLNVAFGAALGLIFHFQAKKESSFVDRRYKLAPRDGVMGIVHQLESAFAKLTTLQITIFVVCMLLSVGVIVTYSRGAIASWGISLFLVLFVVSRVKIGVPQILLALFMLVVAFTLLTTFELDDRLAERIQSTQGELQETSTGRRYIWEVASRVIKGNFLTGVGMGNFHLASLPYQSASHPDLYAYAENIYLQSIAELGLPMLLTWIAGPTVLAVFYLSTKQRDKTSKGIFIGSAFVICSQLLHGIVDFAIILPSVFAPVAVMYGASIAPRASSSASTTKNKPRNRSTSLSSSNPSASIRQARRERSQPQASARHANKRRRGLGNSGTQVNSDASPGRIVSAIVSCSLCFTFCVFLGWAILPNLKKQAVAEQMVSELRRIPRRDHPFVDWKKMRLEYSNKIDESVAEVPNLACVFGELQSKELRQAIAESRGEARDYRSAYLESEPVLQVLRRARASDDETDFVELYGNADNLQSAQKHQDFLRTSLVASPLNWQLHWLELKSKVAFSKPQLLLHANRVRVLVQFSKIASERLYWIAETLGDTSIASQQLKQTLRLDSRRIFGVLNAKKLDGSVNLDFAALDLPLWILERLADNHLAPEQFPDENRHIWKEISNRVSELPSSDPNRLFLEGRLLARAGNFVEAVKSFETAASQAPREVRMRIHLIRAWQALERFDKMEIELDRAEQQFPAKRIWTNFRRELNEANKRL